ncbi:LysR family transcriptional regulator [Alcaligenes sp. RM2]|uniref:LysR family transcriptional regulator n=1 Tax=Alcaligenes TaxID=507 RepID=UPI0003B6D923|nr:MULTISPECIES: LysR family transcriptional regulator [Alcaligenes]ERT55042.1 LysR family transcriptional regulator [Alcaligenes sp. EGD-AK7]URW82250.1 LysR family transcriptional regulator [Alcaligenes sp. DN25]UTM00008.1 LysR family transcriptional regulator [Alcaligenes sp. NLF5-7]WEA67072.1 LysR family transcriptional regulator [Alcaligenes faecalis]HRO22064.1 LysR family transcriptional regulator [Alcaligenes phenolicus]
MDTIQSLRVFREIVAAGSFAAAAQRLDMSAPMVSKHLANLEKQLGARLLHRSSRRLSLTELGQTYFDYCLQALDTLERGQQALSGSEHQPQGVLRVTAPVWFANRKVAQLLQDYQTRYPEVTLDMSLSNHKVDLVAEGFDLALRVMREPAPHQIARLICPTPFHLVASPEFVAQHGMPRNCAEVMRLPAISPSYLQQPSFEFLGPDGPESLRLNPFMRSDNTNLTYYSALGGAGLAYLPEWLVMDDLESGRLVRLLPDYTEELQQLHAVYASRRYLTPKVRSFIDFLLEELAEPAK